MDKLYTTNQLAKLFGVVPTTVIAWVEHGELEAWKTLGGHRRIRHGAVLDFLHRHRLPYPPAFADGAARSEEEAPTSVALSEPALPRLRQPAPTRLGAVRRAVPSLPGAVTMTLVSRSELLQYLDSYLDAQRGADFGPNGLQVEGRDEIRKLVTGVSACRELFDRAAAAGADAVLVHHGIFWTGSSPVLVGSHYQRVAALLRHDLSLFAYHLPLDRHPEIGNNFLAARGLSLSDLEPFGDYEGLPVGFRGRFSEPDPIEVLVERCTVLFAQPPLVFRDGPEKVTTLGIISGGAQREFYQAIEAGLDAYLTGEASEWVMNVARESRVHYLACGHYATERLGIRALGEHLAERFGIEVEFLDVPNPV